MMEFGESILWFLETAVTLLKWGCKAAGLAILFVFLLYALVGLIKALREADKEESNGDNTTER